jgi:hypothetical protein
MTNTSKLQIYTALKGLTFEGYMVPEHTQGSLMRYFYNRYNPGSFGVSILAGDIELAGHRADHINSQYIEEIDRWIKEQLPEECHGSYEKVYAWCSNR